MALLKVRCLDLEDQMDNIMERICRECHKSKNLTQDFYKNKKYKDGFNVVCKKCTGIQANIWRDKNRERVRELDRKRSLQKRNGALKRRYGIDEPTYVNMCNIQSGKCFICDIPQSQLSKKLYVDHNHSTGEVRKLLCTNCNAAIGMTKEDSTILLNMINYLESHSPTYEVSVGWC